MASNGRGRGWREFPHLWRGLMSVAVGVVGVVGGCWDGRWWRWMAWTAEVASPVARRGEYPRLWRGLGSVVGGAFLSFLGGFMV